MGKKLELKVCVGSSCHVKGAADTLKSLEKLIRANNIEKLIDLRAELCLANCVEAPNVMVNDKVYGGITPDIVESFFEEVILQQVKECQAQ